MKPIICEMCKSNDLVKQDGMFVCQSCGTKYSVEEAKKLMTVQIDDSKELQNLYELARRAKNDNNSENAQKYYEQIIIKDPSSWEANFYTTYYQAINCKVGEIGMAANRITNCEETVFNLIKDNITDPNERKKAVEEVALKLLDISQILCKASLSAYFGNDNYTYVHKSNCSAAKDILYNAGDIIVENFGEAYGDVAAECWKGGVKKESNEVIQMEYNEKISKYDPSYEPPAINSGCYVATAVYGSYDCPQVWVLRRYRDFSLAKTWYGRAFIRLYYSVSPTLVKWFGHKEWFKKMWIKKLDKMINKLQEKGFDNTPYDDMR